MSESASSLSIVTVTFDKRYTAVSTGACRAWGRGEGMASSAAIVESDTADRFTWAAAGSVPVLTSQRSTPQLRWVGCGPLAAVGPRRAWAVVAVSSSSVVGVIDGGASLVVV